MRKRRHLVAGAEYHVVARANRKEFILETQQMKQLMLSVLDEAKKKFRFEMKNFCIMSNHIHLLIKPIGKENLSNIMQWVLSVFAIRFNKAFGIHGHVWYDRFKSVVILTFRRLLDAFNYIAENPVQAGLVKLPHMYRYGGLWHIRAQSFDLVDPPSLALSFGLLTVFDAKVPRLSN